MTDDHAQQARRIYEAEGSLQRTARLIGRSIENTRALVLEAGGEINGHHRPRKTVDRALVLRMVEDGRKLREIAARLGVSVSRAQQLAKEVLHG